MRYFLYFIFLFACFAFTNLDLWGFYGHRKITELAIYTLPPGMIGFYKQNTAIIIQKSVAPDQRRYVIDAEGPKHYIDLDEYGNLDSIPKYWFDAVERFGEDTLVARGTVPWSAYFTYKQLIIAFKERNYHRIITKSCDLAHYLADANVPLHTTSNYNGQKTGQRGVHGFWETRLPVLYSDDYDFFVGRASYVDDPQAVIWQGVFQANRLVDSLLRVESEITELVGASKKYAFEDNGKRTTKVYSEKYSNAYHNTMPAVELQMQRSVKIIGDFWFTAWIEAGQPDLSTISKNSIINADTLDLSKTIVPLREHEH